MIGKIFSVALFGESHGPGVGALIKGCPPGIKIDEEHISLELSKRRIRDPRVSTQRIEPDEFDILAGIYKGYTTGAPILIFIKNKNIESKHYEEIRFKPRPSHADYTAYIKYHGYNDYRGGGIFSGRITAAMVAAGAIAKKVLEKFSIEVLSYIKSVGDIELNTDIPIDKIREKTYLSPVRCPDEETSRKIYEFISKVREMGDSVGGIVETIINGVPPGLGDPPIDTLDGDLAKAILTIPGVKGIEFGEGFKLSRQLGSDANDPFIIKSGKIMTMTNKSGGINGGISNGMPIVFRVAFKPTPSIYKPQRTVDLKEMRETTIRLKGRFDPCIAIRAVPVVESISSIIMTDHLLRWMAWEKYLEGNR